MKKLSKLLSLLIMSAMLVLCFTACGNSGGGATENKATESKVKGQTYELESYTVNGKDSLETLNAMYSEWSLSFKDDGACSKTIVWAGDAAQVMGTDPVVQTGTYEENGDTVKVTFKVEGEDDTVMEFKIESDTIKLVEDSNITVFKSKANS